MLIIVNHCSFLMIFMVITDSGLLLTTYYTRIPSGLLRHFKQCIEQVILYCMALDGSRNPSASSGLAHRNESMTMFDHNQNFQTLDQSHLGIRQITILSIKFLSILQASRNRKAGTLHLSLLMRE